MVTKRAVLAPAKGAPPKKITAWSYSRYRDWKRCPFYAKCKYVDRMPEPGSPAIDRGGEVHKMAQNFVEAKRAPVKTPDELACFEVEFKDLRKAKALCENEWAFTREWQPTGWFDKDCWLRVKMDVHHVDTKANRLTVIDHKTGKVSDKFEEQEELYALAGLLQYPTVDDVLVQFWFLDAGEISSTGHGTGDKAVGALYTRAELPGLLKKWEKMVGPMLSDTRFPPKANWACGRCAFSKANGGPCKF
jgi:hypothetical protein